MFCVSEVVVKIFLKCGPDKVPIWTKGRGFPDISASVEGTTLSTISLSCSCHQVYLLYYWCVKTYDLLSCDKDFFSACWWDLMFFTILALKSSNPLQGRNSSHCICKRVTGEKLISVAFIGVCTFGIFLHICLTSRPVWQKPAAQPSRAQSRSWGRFSAAAAGRENRYCPR